MRLSTFLLAAALALGTQATTAYAENGSAAASPEMKAAARTAAQNGFQAYEAGEYETALDLFERAESLVHAPTHLLYIARSSAKVGKLVRAQEMYIRLGRESLPADAPEAFHTAKANSGSELAALKPRVPMLTLKLEGADAEGVTVEIDGNEVPAALLGIAQPIDPGKHRATAQGPGVSARAVEFSIDEGGQKNVTLDLVEGAPPETSDASPLDGGRSTSGLRAASYTAFGLGAVGAALGTVFLIQGFGSSAEGKKLFDECEATATNCSPTDRDAIVTKDEDAARQKTMGIIGAGVGAAALTTGLVLLILDGRKSNKSQAARGPLNNLRPWASGSTLGLKGNF